MKITNRPNGEMLSKKIFGKKTAIVPYVMPGFKLAQKINEVYSKNPNIDCLILLNHGIFTFADNAKDAYSLMIKYISDAEKTLTKLKKKKIKQIKKTKFNFSTADIAPILRGLLSEKNANKFILNFKKNRKLDYFINGKDINRYSNA